jgi:hypothetical protein
MSHWVVDTNVILVANGGHPGVSHECVIACAERLNAVMASGILVLDDGFRIVSEYQQRTSPWKAKGVGDLFVKWVLTNLGNLSRVHQVPLTELEPKRFREFPDAQLESGFDPDDRKFAAVSNAHLSRPSIIQASDCKWLNWCDGLKKCGIVVEFVCPQDIVHFYRNKFPGIPVPTMQ